MDEQWGAYCSPRIKLAATGSGLLNGKTFAVKDIFSIAGHVCGAGSPDWKRTHAPANTNAPAVNALLDAGASLNGTTHTDELMFSLNGENYHYGTPINPRALQHIPGGSSSGSAVAVAAGLVDFALGSDTAGSMRVPASYCGIYGMRPSQDAISLEGVVPLAPLFDTVGWATRDADLLLQVGQVLLGRGMDAGSSSESATGFETLLYATDLLANAEPSTLDAVRPLISQLRERFTSIRRQEIAEEGLGVWMDTFRLLQGAAIWQTHGDWIAEAKPRFGPGVAERFAWSATLKDRDLSSAQYLHQSIRQRMRDLLGGHTVIAVPTVPAGAPLRNTGGAELEARRTRTLQICCVAGLGGLPQITIPATTVHGLPIGLSLIAGPGQDLSLLRLVRDLVADGVFRTEAAKSIIG